MISVSQRLGSMEMIALRQGLKFRQAELGARLHESSFQKIFRIFAILAGVVFLTGVIAFNLRNPVILKSNMSSVPITIAAESSLSAVSRTLGVNIANNGSVFIQGGKVTEISDNAIKVDVSWDSTNFAWVVQTTKATKFLNNQGQKQTIADIKVGDIVMVTGNLVGDNDQLAVKAEFIRE